MEYDRRLVCCIPLALMPLSHYRTQQSIHSSRAWYESSNSEPRHGIDSRPNTTPQARPRVRTTSSGGRGSPPSASSGSGLRFHREREYLSASLRRANSRIDHLMARERACHRELESLEESLEDAQRDNTSLKTRLRQLTEDNQAKTGYLRITQNKLAIAQHQLQETRRDNARLQEEVRVAQDAVFHATEKKEAHPMEDREVRDKFVVFEERLRGWARNYTVDDIGKLHSASTNEMNRIISQLDGYCIQEDWSKLHSRFSSLKKKIPFMLSQAVLAQAIFKDVFGSAFFVFPTSPTYCNTPNRGQIDALHQTLRQCGEK